jgi:hypothetical protein
LEDGNRIRLWAFGAAIEWNGVGLYLQRANLRAGFFDPREELPTHFPLTRPLSQGSPPITPIRSPLLAQALFFWIADYEEWIRQSQPEGYRRDLTQHHKLSLIHGDELVNAWRILALDMGDLRELDSSKCQRSVELTRLQTLVNGPRFQSRRRRKPEANKSQKSL